MRRHLTLPALMLVALTASADVSARAPATVGYDVILRHGEVIDGTGAPRYRADVAVKDGRIVRVGDLSGARATTEIDATGLFVAPGFINIHSHPDPEALPTAANMLTQGVTTEITNPDGGGPVDVEAQLAGFGARRLAVNIGGYIGFNSVWREVMGSTDRRASAAEVARMQALIEAALADGAWGVSAGLDYKPAYFADTDEVAQVVSAARNWRTNFTNHERLIPETGFSSRAGIAETIAIAEQAGLAPVITHMKAQGVEQGRAGEILGMMAKARTGGRFSAGDVYPYTAGQGPLAAIMMPAWATEGGEAAMTARFKDPEQRRRIVADIERAMTQRFGGVGGVYVSSLKRELGDVAREMGVSPGEAVVRLLERGKPLYAFLRFGDDRDVVAMLRDPFVAVACDCGSTSQMAGHPRTYGTFPKVLGRHVRERGDLSWEAAVRKMTGLPAGVIGLTDRGFIAPGMAADITVFDPRTIVDRATYDEPVLSEGVREVLVNGRLALHQGKPTGEQGGQVLRRARNMPTREAPRREARSLTASATAPGPVVRRVRATLTQGPAARSASGVLEVREAGGRLAFVADAFGLIQTTRGWASATGVGRLASGEHRSFMVTVDRADPADPRGSLTLLIDGEAPIAGVEANR